MANPTAKWFGSNAVAGAYQAVVGVVVIAVGTSLIAWLRGLTFFQGALFALVATLTLSVSVYIASAAYVRIKLAHSQTNLSTPEPMTSSQFAAHHARESDLIGKLNQAENEIERLTNQAVCPYAWSHRLIELQSEALGSWIYFEKFQLEDLDFGGKRPFLVFSVKLRNGSVYRIALTDFEGAIIYGQKHIEGTAKWTVSPLRLEPGQSDTAVFKYVFEDAQDTVYLRNVESSFGLGELKFFVETDPPTQRASYPLRGDLPAMVPATMIARKYPKLKIDIKQPLLTSHYVVDNGSGGVTRQGSYISLLIEFKNPRADRITISEFKVNTSARVTLATKGLIYQNSWIEDGKLEHHTPLAPNLADSLPILADKEEPIEGWVQFFLKNVKSKDIAFSVNLVIVDTEGEEHVCGTPNLIDLGTAPPRRTG